jgi:23S rRNA pseudouridine1911/1915/1917 synthase
MDNEKLEIIYQDENLLVVDKPAGIVVFPEGNSVGETLIDMLLEQFPFLRKAGSPPRYGIIHRLDKETSGILLVAKNNEALEFLQKKFKEIKVVKKYIALIVGNLKKDSGEIKTLIGRSPKNRLKQKVFSPLEPNSKGKREAITNYKTLSVFYGSRKEGQKNYYVLLEVCPKTGRKHQIRAHLSYLGYPIAGDKLYGFKNQIVPEDLKRQFLHASFLEINLFGGKKQTFESEISKDLKKVLKKLNEGKR